MQLLVLGFGKMGQAVKRLALARGHSVITVDPAAPGADFRALTEAPLSADMVAVDFTHPATALANITAVLQRKLSLVVGTTGWHEQMKQVRELVAQSQCGLLYAANFSIGVHLFSAILQEAARRFRPFPEYDVAGVEWHHNAKADSPSGTALALAAVVQEQLPRKSRLVCDRLDQAPQPEEFHFASVRCGSIPGTHEITFDSAVDTITLRHSARSRDGFALGAVLAAEWLPGRRGLFTLADMMSDLSTSHAKDRS